MREILYPEPSLCVLLEADKSIKRDKLGKAAKKTEEAMKNLRAAVAKTGIDPAEVEAQSTAIGNLTAEGFVEHIKHVHNHFRLRELPMATAILVVMLATSVAALAVLNSQVEQGKWAALIINALFIGPLIEEYAKRFANKHGAGNTFIVTFSWGEFAAYAAHFAALGINGVGIICARLLSAIGHFFMHQVQTKNVSVSGKAKDDTAGYKTAVVIHMLWNAIGLLFGEALGRMLGI